MHLLSKRIGHNRLLWRKLSQSRLESKQSGRDLCAKHALFQSEPQRLLRDQFGHVYQICKLKSPRLVFQSNKCGREQVVLHAWQTERTPFGQQQFELNKREFL